MFTSNYKLNGKHPAAIAISVYPPSNYNGRNLKVLAPNFHDVIKLKKNQITEHQYAVNYFEKLDELDPSDIIDNLPDDSIFLCYEDPFEFCHRRLFAMWIENKTGVIIPELLPTINNKQYTFIQDTLEF